MKNIITVLLSLTFFLTSCEMSKSQSYEIPKSEQSVNKLLYHIANTFEKKYNLNAIATNVSMPGGVVKKLGLDFQIHGPLSKEELRKILVALAQEFLNFVNEDVDVRFFLKQYPFEIKNIEITLFLIDSKGFEIKDPNIGISGISNGKLDYQMLIFTDIPIVKNESEETYDDALKTLQGTE